jgi:hypothetical protein
LAGTEDLLELTETEIQNRTRMKFTKTQARACYDAFHGALWCLNGGTREENERNAARCRELLAEQVEVSRQIVASPTKALASDEWLMERMRDLPARLARFDAQYPGRMAEVINFS